jgi:hypothetical protein
MPVAQDCVLSYSQDRELGAFCLTLGLGQWMDCGFGVLPDGGTSPWIWDRNGRIG